MEHGQVAIVGGRGYLGSALSKRLVSLGIPFRVVGRQSAVEAGASGAGEYRSSSPDLAAAISGASVVVHLATLTTPAIGAVNPHLDMENVNFTLSLLDACVREKIGRIVYVSSGGTVYGEATSPIDETQPVNPMCSYAIAKVTCENYLRQFAAVTPVKVTVLRISNAYGGGQVKKGGQGVVSYLAEQIARRKPVTLFGDTVRDYVYIEDVVDALLLAMKEQQLFGIYNISTGVGTSLVDLAQAMGHMMGRGVNLSVGELRPYDLRYNVLNNAKAKSMLGWSPQYDLAAGLREYLGEHWGGGSLNG